MIYYQALVLLALLLIANLVRRNHADYRVGESCHSVRIGEVNPHGPLVSILVPARNEAAHIEACLDGLVRQGYPHAEIWVLDDGSTDDTAARVRRLSATTDRLHLLHGTPLPPGWAGKASACRQLAGHARGEWLLFLDADTRSTPELLGSLVAAARATEADLISTFPRQQIGSLGEAITVPFIYWFLFTLLPIRQVWESRSLAFTAACGQLLFARREAYFQSGGHAAISGSLHDGLHLARLFKRHGLHVRLVDLSDHVSCRMYHGWRESWQGFTRNAFQAVGSLPVLMALTVLQLSLCLGPFLAVPGLFGAKPGIVPVLIFLQVGVLLGIQVGLKRRFRYPWSTVLLHPLGIAAWLAIYWRSWWLTCRRAPVAWKGRVVATGMKAEPDRQPVI